MTVNFTLTSIILRKLQWLEQIEITPPKNYGLKTNTVSHFPKLINLLIKRLQKGEIQHVGIIADADYVAVVFSNVGIL
ncbi:MAG: hypothetical protein DRR16_19745 [Candidatus Parabeggiatoa sp. nov. 3]|nr:MAG: hypothetical protein DRR00_19580 [Gammaproteobacteria bacterium]RKZ61377.1 MAG: hypothetical protein DRQ99_20540 [Gammaproteobacteria bacterium]RKZ82404.1 MAG: hypothetical protein DRR16_19745 [Gammaproteobacteria bacterium]